MKPGIYYESEPGSSQREVILEKIGKSPRTIWIELGNKCREIYEHVWICKALLDIDPELDYIIISDLRFPNEVAKVKELGGTVVKVTRPGVPVSDDASDSALDDFVSWDLVLENNGTMMDLYEMVEALE